MECHLGPDLRPVGNDSPGDEHGPLCREDDEHHCRTQFAPCERECPDDGARKRTRAPTRGTSMDLFLRFRVKSVFITVSRRKGCRFGTVIPGALESLFSWVTAPP